MSRKMIALIGGGPACMMAALELSQNHEVHIYEKGKSIGRKFLVAGNGGFNLTNAALNEELYSAYSDHEIVKDALFEFDSSKVREWLNDLDVPTYIGSSNRVFPEEGIKPAEVLKKIKDRLALQGVKVHLNQKFIGFTNKALPIIQGVDETEKVIIADHYVFGLGGGSWRITGANDEWFTPFEQIGIKAAPFLSSNCGVEVGWEPDFIERFEGEPLKNIELEVNGKRRKGEAIISTYGLEGNAIYPLVPIIRDELKVKPKVQLLIDLKPNNSLEELLNKVKSNTVPKNYRYLLNLNKATFNLVKNSLSKADFFNPIKFVNQLKRCPLFISTLRPIDEAISTVGGIEMTEINSNFELIKYKHISIVGEMLNWDAPTGGYLLQGCFSIGKKAAKGINDKLNQ